MFGAQHIFITN